MSTLLKLKNVEKTYTSRGAQPVQALVNISFTVESGEFVAIMGESGSGKSTLLNLIATLDNPTGGEITLNGQDLRKVKEGHAPNFGGSISVLFSRILTCLIPSTCRTTFFCHWFWRKSR